MSFLLLVSVVLFPVRSSVKIQLWDLGFVNAYENSILRGQGLST